MYSIIIHTDVTWHSSTKMLCLSYVFDANPAMAIDVRFGKWQWDQLAASMTWPWTGSPNQDVTLTPHPDSSHLLVTPYTSYFNTLTTQQQTTWNTNNGNPDFYDYYSSGWSASGGAAPFSGTNRITLEITGDDLAARATAKLYIDGTLFLSCPFNAIPNQPVDKWTGGNYIVSTLGHGPCMMPYSYGSMPQTVKIGFCNGATHPLRTAGPFPPQAQWLNETYCTIDAVTIEGVASSLDYGSPSLSALLSRLNVLPRAYSLSNTVNVPHFWYGTGLPWTRINHGDAYAYMDSTCWTDLIYLYPPEGGGIVLMPDGRNVLLSVQETSSTAPVVAYRTAKVFNRHSDDAAWTSRANWPQPVGNKHIAFEATDAATKTLWQQLGIQAGTNGRVYLTANNCIPRLLANADGHLGGKQMTIQGTLFYPTAGYQEQKTCSEDRNWETFQNVAEYPSTIYKAKPLAWQDPYGYANDPVSGQRSFWHEPPKTHYWFDHRGNNILGVGLERLNATERIFAHAQDSKVYTIKDNPRTDLQYAPYPWCYQRGDGRWQACWFADNKFVTYDSDTITGDTWKAGKAQSLSSEWRLVGINQWHGRNGTQFIVGCWTPPHGGTSKVILYTRDGEDSDLSDAYFNAPVAKPVAPYVYERTDGQLEIGWWLTGQWWQYVTDTWTDDYSAWNRR